MLPRDGPEPSAYPRSIVARGMVQNGRFMGCTETVQSRANQGILRFASNLDLNHVLLPVRDGTKQHALRLIIWRQLAGADLR